MKLKIEVNHEGAAALEKLARLEQYRGWSRERLAGHLLSIVAPQWLDGLMAPIQLERLDDDGQEGGLSWEEAISRLRGGVERGGIVTTSPEFDRLAAERPPFTPTVPG